jgi:hypothetical protein
MAARSFQDSNRGFYVAAKGGHNAESHNHNDVGNFIVYADGYPAIIDVGVETYTAKTFSSRRYEIWTMQSAYHNLPTINGVMQKDGKAYKAAGVRYEATEKSVTFSLDLSAAYPGEAQVRSYVRTITLNRNRDVTVRDKCALAEVTDNLKISLMSWREPQVYTEGMIRLANPPEISDLAPLTVRYDEKKFHAIVETIPLEDARLRSSWGDRLYRIVLTAKQKLTEDDFTINIGR